MVKAVKKLNVALEKLEVEYVAIGDIKPNDYNPNRQSDEEFELLLRSIREDGFTQPVVVAEDYTIVDGEHRWRAAASLGMEEIPVVRVPMAAAQARIATLRHNRARGSEDLMLTAAVLRDLEALGALDWAADSLQLSDVEVQRLLEDLPAAEALAGAEFSGAWEPGQGEGHFAEGQASATTFGSATPEAIAEQRKAEQAVAAATTEEEKAAARRDTNIYRLVLTFGGEEAVVVKAVLGEHPAEALVALCRAEAARE